MKIQYGKLNTGDEFNWGGVSCMKTNSPVGTDNYKFVYLEGTAKGCTDWLSSDYNVDVEKPINFSEVKVGQQFTCNGGLFVRTETGGDMAVLTLIPGKCENPTKAGQFTAFRDNTKVELVLEENKE